MRFLHKLIPDFLWDMDLRMQQTWPRLWSTHIHLHLWFLLLINSATALLAFSVKVTERKFPDPEDLFGYMMIPATVYFAFWVFRVVRFTVEKQFGEQKFYAPVGELLIHWISIVLIMSIPYTFSLVVAHRVASLTPDEEFIAEVDHLNQQAPWFYDDGSRNHYYDGVGYAEDYADDLEVDQELIELQKTAIGRKAQGGESHQFFRDLADYRTWYKLKDDYEARRAYAYHDHYLYCIRRANETSLPGVTLNYDADTAAYYHAIADSIELHSPLLYIEHGKFKPDVRSMHFMSDSLLLRHYIDRVEGGLKADRAGVERAVRIANKYAARVRLLHQDTMLHQFEQRKISTARLGAAITQINRISEAKALNYDLVRPEALPYGLVFPSFLLALLLGAFKNSYWQPFLIAAVVAAVLPIILFILTMIVADDIIPYNEGAILSHSYWLIGAFLILMLVLVYSLKTYQTTRAVMLILANAILPFFAVFTLLLLHEDLDVFGQQALAAYIETRYANNAMDVWIPLLEFQQEAISEQITFYLLGTLWGGLFIYTFLLHPFVRRLYMRLYALPERK